LAVLAQAGLRSAGGIYHRRAPQPFATDIVES